MLEDVLGVAEAGQCERRAVLRKRDATNARRSGRGGINARAVDGHRVAAAGAGAQNSDVSTSGTQSSVVVDANRAARQADSAALRVHAGVIDVDGACRVPGDAAAIGAYVLVCHFDAASARRRGQADTCIDHVDVRSEGHAVRGGKCDVRNSAADRCGKRGVDRQGRRIEEPSACEAVSGRRVKRAAADIEYVFSRGFNETAVAAVSAAACEEVAEAAGDVFGPEGDDAAVAVAVAVAVVGRVGFEDRVSRHFDRSGLGKRARAAGIATDIDLAAAGLAGDVEFAGDFNGCARTCQDDLAASGHEALGFDHA